MSDRRLRVFVSSRMRELAVERRTVKRALDDLEVDAWVFEEDAGARPESIRETYGDELEDADLYVGLFWRGCGQHTIEEFELARARGKDCLVYEKREAPENRDPALQEFLNKLSRVETGITVQRFSSLEELTKYIRRDVARWQARAIRRGRQTPARADPDQIILLDKVRRFWIEGVLERSLSAAPLANLDKEVRGEAVVKAWDRVVRQPDRADRKLERGQRIIDVFVELDRSLLILGDPGSGKTTTLLELARDLIARAEYGSTEPIPVVLNLSSWARGRALHAWILEELNSKYNIPREYGRKWLAANELLLLLDGLDEVALQHQEECVEAINRFRTEHGLVGMAVASRTAEYEGLTKRLMLGGAIELHPLTPDQVDAYLANAGPHLAPLRASLRKAPSLLELARSPLLLSVMRMAYADQSCDVISPTPAAAQSRKERLDDLFDAYVRRMFLRVARSERTTYSVRQMLYWLHCLGKQMTASSQTVFQLDHLQPGVLASPAARILYVLGSRIVTGVIIGFLLAGLLGSLLQLDWINTSTPLAAAVAGALSGLTVAFIDTLFPVRTRAPRPVTRIIRTCTRVLLVGGAAGTVVALTPGLVPAFLGYSGGGSLTLALFFGVVFGVTCGTRGPRKGSGEDIRAVEGLTWVPAAVIGVLLAVGLLPAIVTYTLASYHLSQQLRQKDTLREVETGAELVSANQVQFNRARSLVGTADLNGIIRISDLEGHPVEALNLGATASLLSFSPDGKRILAISDEGRAVVWSLDTGRTISTFDTGEVYLARWVGGADRVLTVDEYAGRARLWDVPHGAEMEEFQGRCEKVTAVIGTDGPSFATYHVGARLRLWDAATLSMITELTVFMSTGEWDRVLSFSPDGSVVAIAPYNQRVRWWDARTGVERIALEHEGNARSVAFSSDGARLLIASNVLWQGWRGGWVTIWDVNSGSRVRTLAVSRSGFSWAVFDADGKRAVTSEFSSDVRVWDAETGSMLLALGKVPSFPRPYPSPDGTTLLLTDWGGISAYDLRSGAQM
jgi:DNA polymerase III delta prime subunit